MEGNPNHHSAHEAEKSQHFLLQYLENMRVDLTKSIERKFKAALQRRIEDREGHHQTSLVVGSLRHEKRKKLHLLLQANSLRKSTAQGV